MRELSLVHSPSKTLRLTHRLLFLPPTAPPTPSTTAPSSLSGGHSIGEQKAAEGMVGWGGCKGLCGRAGGGDGWHVCRDAQKDGEAGVLWWRSAASMEQGRRKIVK